MKENIWRISALASKLDQINKNIGPLLHILVIRAINIIKF